MRNPIELTIFAAICAVTMLPTWAATELKGQWAGPFNGVEIEVPILPGPFEAGRPKVSEAPRYIETTLTLDFDTQQKGLLTGTWISDQYKRHFVCAQLNQALWNCVDATGRASIELTSPTEIKVCYLHNLQGAQGAGCGLLRKSS